jgi:hypothetical protein
MPALKKTTAWYGVSEKFMLVFEPNQLDRKSQLWGRDRSGQVLAIERT